MAKYTIPAEDIRAVVFDGTNHKAILDLARAEYIGIRHGLPVIKLDDGEWTVQIGWGLYRDARERLGLAGKGQVLKWVKAPQM